MDIDAFMKGESIERKILSGGTTNGRIATEYERPNYKEDKVVQRTLDYAKPFVDKIKDEVWKVSVNY